MRRRDLLRLSAGAAMLATPHIARAQRERTLKYAPTVGLSLLDPVWSAARGSHVHAYMVFDTLYPKSGSWRLLRRTTTMTFQRRVVAQTG